MDTRAKRRKKLKNRRLVPLDQAIAEERKARDRRQTLRQLTLRRKEPPNMTNKRHPFHDLWKQNRFHTRHPGGGGGPWREPGLSLNDLFGRVVSRVKATDPIEAIPLADDEEWVIGSPTDSEVEEEVKEEYPWPKPRKSIGDKYLGTGGVTPGEAKEEEEEEEEMGTALPGESPFYQYAHPVDYQEMADKLLEVYNFFAQDQEQDAYTQHHIPRLLQQMKILSSYKPPWLPEDPRIEELIDGVPMPKKGVEYDDLFHDLFGSHYHEDI
jgi:hypothetical protein